MGVAGLVNGLWVGVVLVVRFCCAGVVLQGLFGLLTLGLRLWFCEFCVGGYGSGCCVAWGTAVYGSMIVGRIGGGCCDLLRFGELVLVVFGELLLVGF